MKQQLSIQGMHCVSCAMSVEDALEQLPGVKSARVHYARQLADVDYDERLVTHEQLLAAVAKAGYQVKQR